MASVEERLRSGPPLVLDGAMGTELLRRGVDVSLPLWSARALESAPEQVLAIHHDYVDAGADIITANTFRTTVRTYGKIERNRQEALIKARRATFRAVQLARQASDDETLVAGSLAPLEDCYCPELFPGTPAAREEFVQQERWLEEAGVDMVLVETMIRADETRIALEAAGDYRVPRWVSFLVKDEGHLLGGDPLDQTVRLAEDLGAGAILLNCSNLLTTLKALETVLSATDLPAGIYPNLGRTMPSAQGEIEEVYPLDEFLSALTTAIPMGIRVVGSCCGSGPDHTRALRKAVDTLI
ncbi:MAG: homocysteine S-methyltransferase family protein [Fidelibacterota bacterium]